jgi:hypothetical protein
MATPGEKASDKTVLKITKSVVEGLKADGKWRWDTVVQGFGVRRQVKGAFYYLRFRLNGRQHIKSIGRHGSPWTPDMARTKAKEALGEVAKGRDPFAERGRVAESFGAEVPRFLERKRTALKPRTFVEVERHLTIHAAPLHRLSITVVIFV